MKFFEIEAIGLVGDKNSAWSHLFWTGVLSIAGLFLLFSWPSLTLLIKIYTQLEGYSHGLMVPIVWGYATYQLWTKTKYTKLKPSWTGLPMVALGIIVTIFAYWYYISSFKSLRGIALILCMGLLSCVLGFYLSIGGWKALRLFRFPLIYLFFMVPLPEGIATPLTVGLRSIVSAISEDVLGGFGVTVFREGNIIHLHKASLGIADACSGINSLWMLMAGAALIAYLGKLRPTETVFLCLFSFPTSILMNVIRVVFTAFLVSSFGDEFAAGWRHDLLGWLTFVGGVVLIMGFGNLFSSNQGGEKIVRGNDLNLEANQGYGSELRTKKLMLMLSLGIIIAIGASGTHIIRDHYVVKSDSQGVNDDKLSTGSGDQIRKPLSDLSDQIGSFHQIADIKLDEIWVDSINADESLIRVYRNDRNEIVKLRIYYWKPLSNVLDSSQSPAAVDGHIPDKCYPASGFKWIKAYDSEIEIPGIKSSLPRRRLYRKAGDNVYVLYWYRNTRDLTPLTSRDSLARARELFRSWKQPLLTGRAQFTIAISVDITPETYSDAQRTVMEFAKEIAKVLPQYGIN